jgi:Sec-independent protein secretion pathway component TatC
MIAMALPMCLLYESCIWITWFVKRKEKRAALNQRDG